ncbi:hypothetical protein GCM10022224_005360 [Nonomuraea antimicrobica]|uniref:Uncharacterized protein n=1 Tax=Nonomuraea antimicrobica TaxID=561173 RepID=A0ABP7B2J3_9ACTN
MGEGRRATLAALALAVTSLIIYALFSSGFGRPQRAAAPTPEPVPVRTAPLRTAPVQAAPVPARPANPADGRPGRVATLGVVSGDFWLTYLPERLARRAGGAGPARFGSAGRFVEAQVEHGTVAADWDAYRRRIAALDARATTVRGRPAVVGRHPEGGRVIAWLERPGVGAWIRVSDSLRRELVVIAASVRAPVGD